MKKILISLVFVLALTGIAFASYATGWTMENSTWVYYESDGSKVTSAWRTSADGGYYYLDGYGNMLVNSFVDERYVDSDGRMVTSAWRQLNGTWYYFDANGKMAQDAIRQINGNYYWFGGDGGMLTGWIQDEDDWYYCDTSDGHVIRSAWRQLAAADGMDIQSRTSNYNGMYDIDYNGDSYWFYFQPNGKAARAEDKDYQEFIIGSDRYAFDIYGRMCLGWVRVGYKGNVSTAVPTIANYKYYNDDESLGTYGAAHVGWLSAYPPSGESDVSSAVEWYYFSSTGEPYFGEEVDVNSTTAETLEANFKRITVNGKTNTYLFNENGNPVYGLRRVQRRVNNTNTTTSMYFGTKEQSCLQYGETRITEANNEVSSFYFTSAGYGYTGVHNNKLYYMGKLQKAQTGTYAYIQLGEGGKIYLVTSGGTVKKSLNIRNENAEYRSDANGESIDPNVDAELAEEPVFNESDT